MRQLTAASGAALVALALSCAGNPKPPSDPVTLEAELRRRVATNPRDLRAHRDLGRIYLGRGKKGVALRHLEAAGKGRASSDTSQLAGLYQERARARLDAGDLAAIADVKRARELGRLDPALTKRALLGAALANFRRGDPEALAAGRAFVRQAERLASGDQRAALIEPDLAPVAALGEAALWLEENGAKRFALEMLRRYRHRGGSDALVLLGLRRMEQWWGSEAIVVAKRDAGEQLIAALDDWLHGRRRGWLRESDKALAAELETASIWARPTLLRLAGREAEARLALATARKELERLAPRAQAVVLAELALSDPDGPPLPQASGELAWLVYSRARRAKVPAALEATWDIEVPAAVRAVDHAIGLELDALAALGDKPAGYALARLALIDAEVTARLGQATPPTPPTDLAWVAPLGAVDPVRLATDLGRPATASALADIAGAIALDPALADRRAREWIEEAVLPHHRAALVIELFVRAGDPARALRFAEALLEASPDHPTFLEIAAVRAAATGDESRAQILASQAAARSGDAGATYRHIASEFFVAGANLAAIAAGRRALALSAPRFEEGIRVIVARAMLRLARRADARELLDDPSVSRESVASVLDTPRSPLPTGQALAVALRWNPSDPDLLAAHAMTASAHAELSAARLAALALYSQDAGPMATWATVLAAQGKRRLAEAAQREAKARGGSASTYR